MHHISVHIENDVEPDDSTDDLADYLYEDVGDREVFMQMWQGSSTNENNSPGLDESNPESPINSISNAYQHTKAAISDMSTLHSIIQNIIDQNDFNAQKISTQEEKQEGDSQGDLLFDLVSEKYSQLEKCSQTLLKSAESLREDVENSQRYFRKLAKLSQHFPLKLITNKEDQTQVSVDLSYPTSTSIVISEGPNDLHWSFSDSSRFSFNSKHFEFSDVPSNYLRCFFELMCHELFERIKNDRIKSAIHYSANKDTRSVYFDIGNRETKPWVFELGPEKENNSNEKDDNENENEDEFLTPPEEQQDNKVPVWIPQLIDLIMDPQAQPATFMRQLLFFKSTLDSISTAFCDRFLKSDFCVVNFNSAMCKAAFQISSPYLYVPYIAFIDKWRVSMTETPNELRCIPYSTDGRGLAPALEKWCDASFSTLFLSMAERVTRSFGFVFKNKNQYGTAIIGAKKIKFEPKPNSNDVEITIISRSKKVTINWKQIPGTDHIVKMCVIIFQDNFPS